MAAYRVLFVCWGNICRSPTAEGIMRRLVDESDLAGSIEVDSAGVSDEHAGSPPDPRAVTEAAQRGMDLRHLRARRVRPDDWDRFDLLLVTDPAVERSLRRQAPASAPQHKVARIVDFVPTTDGRHGPHGRDTAPTEVPDPYYGGRDGFRQVYDLLEVACAGILDHARAVTAPRAAGR